MVLKANRVDLIRYPFNPVLPLPKANCVHLLTMQLCSGWNKQTDTIYRDVIPHTTIISVCI